MKIIPSLARWQNHLPIFVAITCAFFLSPAANMAQADDNIGNAPAVSEQWIKQIDNGKYEESYQAGCHAFHDKVTQEKWVLVLKTIRGIYGEVLGRKQISCLYKPDGFDGLEGECVILTYDTSFKKFPDAMEMVVLKKEDGSWHGAGYNAGPKVNPNSNEAPPSATETESHTTSSPAPNSNQ